MTIYHLLLHALTRFPDRTAVIDGERRFTYRETHGRVEALAGFLAGRGLEPGERVSILAPNSTAFFEAYFAAARDGLILNPLNTRLSANELSAIVADAAPRFLIANVSFVETVRVLLDRQASIAGVVWTGGSVPSGMRVPGEAYEDVVTAETSETRVHRDGVEEHSVAHLYYTSGTTGEPRGVPLTHRNVCAHAEAVIAELGMGERDVWGHFAPMFHLADAWATFAVTWVGGTHVMVPSFGAASVIEAIRDHGVTLSNLVPTMLNDVMHHPAAPSIADSDMRMILSGGAPIAPSLVRKIIDTTRCEYVQTYGLTETSPYLTLSLLSESMRALPIDEQIAICARTGRPMRGVSLRVVDDSFLDVASDDKQVGEIVVRGDSVFGGYWNRPQDTAAAFHQGWFRTGDLAVIDAAGSVNIVDRKKDMIITGGENVYSIEVENVLYRHPAIREAAAFGLPDDHWGEIVAAAVVVHPGHTLKSDDVIAFCRQHLSSFKVPRRVFFMDALPRTGSGKITKTAIRRMSTLSP
jgi:acyl-CoA synthetase (AMP-forming)/AMP-acid ligase II